MKPKEIKDEFCKDCSHLLRMKLEALKLGFLSNKTISYFYAGFCKNCLKLTEVETI